jgi:ariadne-1
MKQDMKFELERYVFFYDRYMDHEKSQNYAKKLNERIETFKPILKDEHHIPYLDLNFLDEIVITVIDSHRMLKNTYIFGYYMIKCKESALYEYHQDMLDIYTDRLHEMIEQQQIPDLCNIVNKEEFDKCWKNFRENALNLQSSIKKFKEDILNEIENKLINLLDYKKLNEENK